MIAEIPSYLPLVVLIVAGLVAVFVLFRSMWRVPEPNQALIISGLRNHRGDGTDETHGFKSVVGHGVLVLPGVQRVRTLNLDLHEAPLGVDCVTEQAIPVTIKGVVIYKVGDDQSSISNAARRFIDQEAQMDTKVHNVFAGHLRSIIGKMSVEQLIREREVLTEEVRDASSNEVQKLGLIIDSMQILEIDDPTGYIENLGKPQQAVIARDARVAQANADREASQAEQIASAQIAEAKRATDIKKAGFQAEVDTAQKNAEQAGPLAEATARQAVLVQEAEAATREAARAEQQLLATVIKPAEADAKATVTRAEAARSAAIAEAEAEAARTEKVGQATASATEATGLAEAAVTEAKGKAEGAAIHARAEALADNQEAVIQQQLVGLLPEVASAIAGAYASIDHMTVLNGAEGVAESVVSIAGQAGAIWGAMKGSVGSTEASVISPAPAASVQVAASGEVDNDD